MRLPNGIVLDKDTTFRELKFSALRREVRIQNEDGTEEKRRSFLNVLTREKGSLFIFIKLDSMNVYITIFLSYSFLVIIV